MRGWYQSDNRAGSRPWTWLAAGWFVTTPLLMWFPAGPDPGPAWATTTANVFHGFWFLIGAGLMRRAWRPDRLSAWIGLVVLGAVFELVQGWIPNRDPSWLDETLNAAGAALGLWWPVKSISRSVVADSDRVEQPPEPGIDR